MVGYVSEAVATAIKNWPELKAAHIVPVRATDGASVVVNTPLPAIAVHVLGESGSGDEGGTAFGGGIRQYFELSLYVMLPLTNYSFSFDGGKQAELLDISDEVIRCMELTTDFETIRKKYDFSVQFDRMETDTAYGADGAASVVIDVHKVVYRGSVQFDPRVRYTPDALLEEVDMSVASTNIKVTVK